MFALVTGHVWLGIHAFVHLDINLIDVSRLFVMDSPPMILQMYVQDLETVFRRTIDQTKSLNSFSRILHLSLDGT